MQLYPPVPQLLPEAYELKPQVIPPSLQMQPSAHELSLQVEWTESFKPSSVAACVHSAGVVILLQEDPIVTM